MKKILFAIINTLSNCVEKPTIIVKENGVIECFYNHKKIKYYCSQLIFFDCLKAAIEKLKNETKLEPIINFEGSENNG
jgi:hypothetical protein